MTRIELQFLAGRYHGTPWGRNVNEGVPEWPPSPYRLLRALYDSWKRKSAHLAEDAVREVLEKLGSEDPTFYLPTGVMAHTRAYLSNNSEDAADKSLVFDAFVAVPKSAKCLVEWGSVSLTAEEERTLATLLEGLNYLGRSESWIAGRLSGENEKKPKVTAKPAAQLENSKRADVVPVACTLAPSEYKGKKKWMDALTDSSREVVKERRSGPLLLRNVSYAMEKEALATWLKPRRRGTQRTYSGVTLALRAKVLPMIRDTVLVGESFRDALIRHISQDRKQKVPGWVHGKDEAGAPERGHPHMFILPQANELGRIDRLFIFRGEGEFVAWELDAIEATPWKWAGEQVQTRIRFFGSLDHPRYRPGACVVASTTPFVTVRHWKRSRCSLDEFLVQEVRRECGNHGLPEPEEVRCLAHLQSGHSPVEHRRHRRGEPSRPGYSFAIRFAEPVPAPFSLGYGCHFGLGQFGRIE